MGASILALIGQAVKEIRLARGMTQQQLADLCEMHRTFIVAVERGRQNASALTLVRIATALDVLPADLFRGFTRQKLRALSQDD